MGRFRPILFWLDIAWRIPVSFLIRAPILMVAYALGLLSERLERIGCHVPGLPYSLWRRRQ